MITKDRFLATTTLLIVAILFYESGNIPEKASWQPHGSALFPNILLLIIAFFSAIIFVKSLIKDNPPKINIKEALGVFNGKTRSIGLFILFGAYALLLPHLGYLIATLFFMLTSQALLMGINSVKKIITILLTSFIIVPAIYFIFRYGLKIWLP